MLTKEISRINRASGANKTQPSVQEDIFPQPRCRIQMASLFFMTLLSLSLQGLNAVLASDTCNTSIDCSLNGICAGAAGSRSCQCDVPWKGVQCGIIEVGEAAPGGYVCFEYFVVGINKHLVVFTVTFFPTCSTRYSLRCTKTQIYPVNISLVPCLDNCLSGCLCWQCLWLESKH